MPKPLKVSMPPHKHTYIFTHMMTERVLKSHTTGRESFCTLAGWLQFIFMETSKLGSTWIRGHQPWNPKLLFHLPISGVQQPLISGNILTLKRVKHKLSLERTWKVNAFTQIPCNWTLKKIADNNDLMTIAKGWPIPVHWGRVWAIKPVKKDGTDKRVTDGVTLLM